MLKKLTQAVFIFSLVHVFFVWEIPRVAAADFKINEMQTLAEDTNFRELVTPKLKKLSIAYSNYAYSQGEITKDGIIDEENAAPFKFEAHPQVVVNKDLKVSTGITEDVNQIKLRNHTDEPLELNTLPFQYTYEDTLEATTMQSVGVEAKKSIDIHFLLNGKEITMAANYDFLPGKTNITTKSHTWEIPTETILVPAHKIYQVVWSLESGKATGTVNLNGDIQAYIPLSSKNGAIGYDKLGDVLMTVSDEWCYRYGFNKREWEVKGLNNFYKAGQGKYEARVAIELNKSVYDITENKTPKLVSTDKVQLQLPNK